MSLAHGFATPGFQGCQIVSSDSIVGLNDPGSGFFSGSVLMGNLSGTPSAAPNRITITTWDTCGWTLSGSADAGAWRGYYLALAGATLKVATGSLVIKASGAPTTVSGLTFKPQLVRLIGSLNIDAGDSFYAVGSAWDDGVAITQRSVRLDVPYVTSGFGAVGTTEPAHILTHPGPVRDTLNSMNADGFTVTPSTTSTGDRTVGYFALADAGGNIKTDSVPWSAATVSTGFLPDFVLVDSAISGEETNGGQLTHGGATNDVQAATLGGFSGGASSRRWGAQSTTDTLIDYNSAGTKTGNATIGSFTSTGFSIGGSSSGFGGAIQYIAIRTSAASSSPCTGATGQIIRYR